MNLKSLIVLIQILFLVINCYTQNVNITQQGQSLHSQWKFNHLTVDHGLSNNFVHSISQDKYGYIWIATSFGLNRFNGLKTEQYFHQKEDSASLNSNFISSLFTDSNSKLWIGTDKGIHLYDYNSQNFIEVTIHDGLEQREVFSITEDRNNKLLVGTSSGLFAFNSKDKYFEKIHLKNLGLPNDSIYRILVDENNNLWITTYQTGLYFYDRTSETITSFWHNPTDPTTISDDWLFYLYKDKNNDIWVGTYNTGFCEFNKEDSTFSNYFIDSNHEFTKRIRTIFEDRYGRLFLGSRQGLFLFNRSTEKSTLYAKNSHKVSVLSQNSITYSYVDKHKNIWLGTHSGGATYFNTLQEEFVHYTTVENNPQFLNTGAVHCFNKSGDKLYIGTEKGINILNEKNGLFTYLINDPFDGNSLSYNDVKDIEIELNGDVWVATNRGGLNLISPNNRIKRIFRHDPNNPNSLPTDNLYNVQIDDENTLWVLSNTDWDRLSCVLSRYDRETDKFCHYNQDFFLGIYESDDKELYIGGVYGFFRYDKENDTFIEYKNDTLIYRTDALYKDDEHNIWIGNNKGLAKFNPKTNQFYDVNKELALGVNEVYGILGKGSDLWVSSNNGLIKLSNIYDAGKITSRFYTKSDGLQSREFNYNAFYADDSGNYYFGGDKGFNIFHPDSIYDNPYFPEVYFSSLLIQGNEVEPNQKVYNKIVLNKSITETKEILLSHKIEDFTINLDVIHYANAFANKYKYRLGNQEKWTYLNAINNSLTFRGLQPGDYHLEVYGINSDGIESKSPAELVIHIIPPFRKTNGFRIIVSVLIVLLIIILHRLRVYKLKNNQKKLQLLVDNKTKELEEFNNRLLDQNDEILAQKEEIQQQRDTIAENSKQLEDYAASLEQKVYERTINLEDAKIKAEESNRLKTSFLENISHEVRTPLNAIIGFIDVITADDKDHKYSKFFEIIKSSGNSLLTIITDIIEFSRIESGALEKDVSKIPLEQFISKTYDDFILELDRNNKICSQDVVLKVQNKELISGIEIFTDIHYFEQIFSNLLSNAIKFTHEGEITFGLESIHDNLFTFYVKDTGIGIGKEEQENIFISFRKAEDKSKRLYRGGGLGLSISKYLTEFLGGSIVLESEIDKGSLFRFSIMSSYSSTETERKILFTESKKIEQPPNLNGKTVLIVEDEVSNFELLGLFLKKTHVNIIWAKDGLEAIKYFAENKEDIDIILMDIKLPKMTGYEASEKIREINRSVPIIAQTAYALTSEIQNYKGNIINDYVIKPINKVMLYTKICQWLNNGCPS